MPTAIWEQFSKSPVQQENKPRTLIGAINDQDRIVEVQNRFNLQRLVPRSPVFSRQTAYEILNPPKRQPDALIPSTLNGVVSYWQPTNISGSPYVALPSLGSDQTTWVLGNTGGSTAVPTYAAGPPAKWSLSGSSRILFFYDNATKLAGYPFNGDHTMCLVVKNVVYPNATFAGLVWFNGATTSDAVTLAKDTDGQIKICTGTGFIFPTKTAIASQPSGNDLAIIITRNGMTNELVFYVNSLTPSGSVTYAGVLGVAATSIVIPYSISPVTSMDLYEVFVVNRILTGTEIAGLHNYWNGAYGVGVANQPLPDSTEESGHTGSLQ